MGKSPGSSNNDDEEEETRLNPMIFHGDSHLHPYEVRYGDTLESIAETVGCTWKDLAMINWGTDDPKEVSWYLENYVGCDEGAGKDYVFNGREDPGILLLPLQLDQADLRLQRQDIRASRWSRK